METSENRAYVNMVALWIRFSERISNLSEPLQEVFFEDLETAIENRLKVLETAK